MSGPTTRPIRNDRLPPLDYPAEQADDRRRYPHQQKEREDEPPDLFQRGAWRRAFLAMVPERFRPGAKLILACKVCLIILPIYTIGSVEWHYNPFLWSARTASAEDVRDVQARLRVVEHDSAVLMRIRISGLQEALCRGYDKYLRLELDQLLEEYRNRNGRYPAAMPCKGDSNP